MGSSLESSAFQLTIPSYPGGVIFGNDSEPIKSIYEESSTQKYRLGTKLYDINNDRVFRYARNGGTGLSKCYMTTSEAVYSYAVEELQSTYGTSAEVGDVEIDVDVTTGGSWTENAFADGWLIVNKATGMGDIYRILANKINSSDDTLLRVRLETAIRTALDATSEITMIKNPWREVDVMPTTAEGTPTGIPLIDVTANYFCWLQTGGIAPIFVDDSDTIVKGQPVGSPTTDAGACEAVGADTTFVYGVAVYVAAADETALVDLKLDS